MSSMNGAGCSKCGDTFRTGEDYRDHLPCESAIEKAVREEREAVVRYLNMFSELSATHYSYSMFKKALENIGRGEHRK